MRKNKSYQITLTLLFSLFLLLNACGDSSKKEYKPKKGQPNISLLTGMWKGKVQSGNSDFVSESRYKGELEMKGKTAGELDILYFKPIKPDGSIKPDGWISKLYVSNGNITYLTNDYPTSSWRQKDSTNFKWFLLGKKFKDEQLNDYKNFVSFERKTDSLFITTGQMMLSDSAFNVNYYSRYSRIK